ncbi:MAG: hypothetical protein ACYCUM_08465, partial [Solirubrobacteraceae bacterium]
MRRGTDVLIRLAARAAARAITGPSLPMSGETLTIEESMIPRARMELRRNVGDDGDEEQWCWGCG